MAGLLAWAADVVGAHGNAQINDFDIPIVFTDDQRKYVQELERKAESLSRTIQDLRLRLPPPDISQRLPHLHAHSLASNAALTLQLNSHSATKEQAQLREVTLLEENAEYEKAISNCEKKIQEKIEERNILWKKLQEMEVMEKTLREELETAEAAIDAHPSEKPTESDVSKSAFEAADAAKSAISDKLNAKKKELSSMEETVRDLEGKWAQIQDSARKQPTPAQREKILDKQIHSLIEQLAAKQTQAEGIFSEIHLKEMELERLNGLYRSLESSNLEATTARNRFGRSNSEKGSTSSDYIADKLPYSTGSRTEHQQRLILLRSAFVLYILFLHILVFLKISF